MWLDHPDCAKIVAEVWSRPFAGYPMAILSQKLKDLKLELKVWNKCSFGDVHQKVKDALAEVDKLQDTMSNRDFSEDLFIQE